MLRRLRVRYEQILAQSLQGAVQLELGLAERPTAIQNAVSLALRLPHQPEQLLPAHTSILQAYEQGLTVFWLSSAQLECNTKDE